MLLCQRDGKESKWLLKNNTWWSKPKLEMEHRAVSLLLGEGMLSSQNTFGHWCVLKASFPMKNPFIKGKALIIVRQTWEDKLYVCAIEKYQAPAETQLNSAVATKGPSVAPQQRQELSTPEPCPRGCTSSITTPSPAQKPSCPFFSWNSAIKMGQKNRSILPVCSPHHERGQPEQSASWVPVPAPAGTWLGLSLGTVTQNKDSGIS